MVEPRIIRIKQQTETLLILQNDLNVQQAISLNLPYHENLLKRIRAFLEIENP